MSVSILYYDPTPDRNEELRQRLREVARPGIGYRMARALILPKWQSEFGALNVKGVYRLWKEEHLARKKSVKKRRTGNKVPLAATRANQVWCLDFCHDACLNGSKLKVLAVKDEYTRECLALDWLWRWRVASIVSVCATFCTKLWTNEERQSICVLIMARSSSPGIWLSGS